MFKSGDIVVQYCTSRINNVNYNDNKQIRLSVVLFETEIAGKNFVCTAPLINNPKSDLKYREDYCYIPYFMYDEIKYNCVKLSETNIYDLNTMHSTGIYLGKGHLNRIFSQLMDYSDFKNNEGLYKVISENISSVQEKRKQKQIRL